MPLPITRLWALSQLTGRLPSPGPTPGRAVTEVTTDAAAGLLCRRRGTERLSPLPSPTPPATTVAAAAALPPRHRAVRSLSPGRCRLRPHTYTAVPHWQAGTTITPPRPAATKQRSSSPRQCFDASEARAARVRPYELPQSPPGQRLLPLLANIAAARASRAWLARSDCDSWAQRSAAAEQQHLRRCLGVT